MVGLPSYWAGPTFLPIETLARSAGSTRSRQDDQGMYDQLLPRAKRSTFFSLERSLKLTHLGGWPPLPGTFFLHINGTLLSYIYFRLNFVWYFGYVIFLLFSALGITFNPVLLDWARIHEHLTEENVLVADVRSSKETLIFLLLIVTVHR